MKEIVSTLYDWVEGKHGEEGYFEERTVVRKFHDSEVRHTDLCTVCGFSTYPECMDWCQNEKWRREKEMQKNKEEAESLV